MNKTKHLKTLFLSVVFMVAIFFCGFVFSACDNNPKDEPQTIDNTQQTTDDKQTKDDTQTTDGEQTVCTITFETDSGSTCEQLSVNSGQSLNEANLSLPTPEKTGYTFVGWFVDSQKTQEFNLNIKITQNQTLYAKWISNSYTYTITYNLDGGNLSKTNPTSYTAESNIKLNNPTKENYTFVGWRGTNLETPAESVTIQKGSYGDRIYTAVWKLTQYTITCVADGEIVNTITQDYGTAVSAPTEPTKDGFRFAGWYSDENLTQYYTFTTMPAGGIRIYASWVDGDLKFADKYFNGRYYNEYVVSVENKDCTSITIPSTFKNLPVTSMSDFYDCTKLTSITIPNNITNISNGVFKGCTNLAEIVVEEGNTVYDSRDNCNAIIKTETNTLVAGCKATTIPNTVTTIGSEAFQGCISLTNITIPASVMMINDNAFYGCSGLESITFAEGSQLTTIGYKAFEGCTSLTSITIPASVTKINDEAFFSCTNLVVIVVEEGNTVYDSRNNCNAIIETETNTLIVGCKNTTIPNTVTTIDSGAFRNCTSLTSITIPASVIYIGNTAFFGSGLESITFAEGSQLTAIGGVDFRGSFGFCTSLTSITIPASVTTIGWCVFDGCSGLKSITFAEGSQLTTIGSGAFRNCTSLTNITIPASVTTIGELAFSGSGLESTTFAEGSQLTTIGNSAFEDCTSLTSITIPASVTNLGYYAFMGCSGLESITFAEGSQFTTIGHYAFRGCRSLTSITIPASVTTIGELAFSGSGLESITFAEGSQLTTIGNSAFNGCKSLTSITIPNTVTTIGDSAFFGSGLKSITIPASVTSIYSGAFNGCTNLAEIVVEEGNTVYDSRDNCNAIIRTATNTLVAGCKATTIPNTVTKIGSHAFEGCTSLTSITIPASVTTIYWGAFYNCSNLE